MPIKIQCANGHTLNAPDNLVGKTVKCPKCQSPVKIEDPNNNQVEPLGSVPYDPLFPGGSDDFGGSTPAMDWNVPAAPTSYAPISNPQPSAATIKPATATKKASQAKQSLNLNWMVVGIAGASTFGLLSILGLVLLYATSSGKKSSNETASLKSNPSSELGSPSEINSTKAEPAKTEVAKAEPAKPAVTKPDSAKPEELKKDPAKNAAKNSFDEKELALSEYAVKLKKIQTAMWQYQAAYKKLPGGKNGLGVQASWRVELLPFLGYPRLYETMKNDELWTSRSNRYFIDLMPDVYRLENEEGGNTRIQVAQGAKFPYHPLDKRLSRDISDDNENTINLIVVGSDKAVPWMSPDDFLLNPESVWDSLGDLKYGLTVATTFNGKTNAQNLLLSKKAPEADLFALFTANGKETVKGIDVEKKVLEAEGITAEQVESWRSSLLLYRSSDFMPVVPRTPEIEKIREKMTRTFFGLNYIASRSRPGANVDSSNRKNLSWRVHLLPAMGMNDLYQEFHLDEPWDSSHNMTLLEKMPDHFKLSDKDGTNTRIQVIQGEQFLFNDSHIPAMASVTDAEKHSIMAVVVGPEKAVPWTSPNDFLFDDANPMQSIGTTPEGILMCLMADGDFLMFGPSITKVELLAMATIHGNEAIDAAAIARRTIVGSSFKTKGIKRVLPPGAPGATPPTGRSR